MTMPYRIELVNGPGTKRTPFKVYPTGPQIVASDEEVTVWDHVQKVEAELEDVKAALAARTTTEQATVPATTMATSGGGKGGRK